MKYAFSAALLIALAVASPAAAEQRYEAHREFFNMDARIDQVIAALKGGNCGVAGQAVSLGLEALYGGLRPLPSRDLRDETLAADQKIADNEGKVAQALQDFALRGDCPQAQARALDLSLLIKQMNEIAVAVGKQTAKCGVDAPCEGLVPFLDEQTGHEVRGDPTRILKPGFFLKLRSPFVPSNYVNGWDEDVFQTEPIANGECVAIFKETRGLMLRLHLVRIDVVRDPWATAMLARGSVIPIFALEWVPSQYGKTWSLCNTGKGLDTRVTQRVKQDIPLTYFWRYFGSASGK